MHQALSRFTTTAVAILEPLSDEELGDLADPDKTWEDVEPIVLRAEELFADQEVVEAVEGEDGEELEGESVNGALEPAPEAAEPDGNLDAAEPEAEAAEGEPAPEAEERAS
jgi:N utilization substance protein A